jgi:subtilisin family serine protease
LDSGIDGGHDAFKDTQDGSRVIKAFDFRNIRKIVSLDNLNTKTPEFKQRLGELRVGRERDLSEATATKILTQLAEDANNDRPIHWELVEKFIKVDPKTAPPSGHGTHVAGIIGASGTGSNSPYADGMCPDIKFYDFRVLGKSLQDTEFAIIAALQYIRYLNERQSYVSVHGANLSLSIPHDVRNFACGRTPICNECERLVESGVVVVAAAGNLGYQRFETKNGAYEGYTAFSITDPGNADGVVTVGATHRYRPHTYGVSFFSSRGPTGDGRLKPDLVAPGERIESCLPNQGWGELDGTSMAAPHVSGAAAMLMARYAELIGQPRRIKHILCESATDLGRERSFQGHGMLDVLRAFQRI